MIRGLPAPLARFARRLRRFVPERRTESTLVWPDHIRLERLHPVKDGRDGNIVNKGGRVVLRGELAGKPIKLYEAWSAEHAAFIAALPAHAGVGELFPAIRARHGRCVVASWIEGEPPADDLPVEILVELQLRLHATPAGSLPDRGYDFWSDFLRPRFLRAGDLLGATVTDVVDRVDGELVRTDGERVVVHPDLRPVNLIRDASGRWVIIDNESVTTSGFPLLDVAHTAHGMRARGTEYWRAYCARAGSPSTLQLDALQAAWLARIVGSSFVAGQSGRAAEYLRRYRAGTNVLPFDP